MGARGTEAWAQGGGPDTWCSHTEKPHPGLTTDRALTPTWRVAPVDPATHRPQTFTPEGAGGMAATSGGPGRTGEGQGFALTGSSPVVRRDPQEPLTLLPTPCETPGSTGKAFPQTLGGPEPCSPAFLRHSRGSPAGWTRCPWGNALGRGQGPSLMWASRSPLHRRVWPSRSSGPRQVGIAQGLARWVGGALPTRSPGAGSNPGARGPEARPPAPR